MHEKLKEITGINIANCETCSYLGSDGDGPEYNGTWPVCDKNYNYSHLKSFPFKKEMKCWYPEFWHSKFADMITKGTNSEINCVCYEFGKAVKSVLKTS